MTDRLIQILIKIDRKLITAWFSLAKRFKPFRPLSTTQNTPLTILYRTSETGYAKNKPQYVNNNNCLRNAVECFPVDQYNWVVIADNCSEQTIEDICKYVPAECVHRVKIGHGAGTFKIAMEMALKLPDNHALYFLENDYVHRSGSAIALLEGLSIADFVTLYDHPDKYGNDHFAFHKGGEKSRVWLTQSSHWKRTSFTTMTFATLVGTLRRNKNVFYRWTKTKHPYDCEIFMELNARGRKLVSPIPSYSTHGEVAYLAPIVDWQKEALSHK